MERTKIALIPAYQPGDALLGLLQELYVSGFRTVVVNDGSGPAYSPVFQAAAAFADVLTHEGNRGKGAALKTGLRHIRAHYAPPYTVVTADADGQHRIGDIRRVTQTAASRPDTLILGSRPMKRGVPLRSKLGNTITRWVFRLSAGSRVYDTQTGLRAFTEELTDRMLEIPGDRYEYEMNVLMDCAKTRIPMAEIPIETIYLDGNQSSHFDTVKDSCRIYKEILKFSASSLVSFLIDYGMFCGLSAATGELVLSNVTARIVSAGVNYTLNKRMVFGHEGRAVKSAASYVTLAVILLILNTGILRGLTALGASPYLAKIGTELLLFLMSYTVQHTVIFRREAERT